MKFAQALKTVLLYPSKVCLSGGIMSTASVWMPTVAGTVVALGVLGVGVFFPLQVKWQAPEAAFVEIYATFWDCLVDWCKGSPPSYRSITTTELVALLETSNKKVLIVDTRTYQDYRNGHIPGSIFLAFNEFRERYHALPKDKGVIIVLTCQFGHYSVVAANKLLNAGYKNVLDYSAGMEEWTNQKRSIATGMVASDIVALPKTNQDSRAASYFALGSAIFATSNNKKMQPTYLDYNATTPLDPRVLRIMMPYLTSDFGNASSRTHSFGNVAEEAVHKGRSQIAETIRASDPNTVVFTSGATESNNLAIQGVATHLYQSSNGHKNHIITCVTEHKSVLDTCQALQEKLESDIEVTYLAVQRDGRIDIQELEEAIRSGRTGLVSIMIANNEIGVVQPYHEIGQLCRSNKVLFHTDGTQGVGKLDIDVERDCIDLLSISGHKIYGPKGVGALYVRKGVVLVEQIHGGGHEGGRRSGSLNVPGVVGLGAACMLAQQLLGEEMKRIRCLRDRLLGEIRRGLGPNICVSVNGSMDHRLAGNLHLSVVINDRLNVVTSEQVLMELAPYVAISSGSACNSRKTGPSHVVVALDLPPEHIACTLRFGIGRFTSNEDIDFVSHHLSKVLLDAMKP